MIEIIAAAVLAGVYLLICREIGEIRKREILTVQILTDLQERVNALERGVSNGKSDI